MKFAADSRLGDGSSVTQSSYFICRVSASVFCVWRTGEFSDYVVGSTHISDEEFVRAVFAQRIKIRQFIREFSVVRAFAAS